jgi:S-disulfanyl-L-cysteine oxidoreductase SoxD
MLEFNQGMTVKARFCSARRRAFATAAIWIGVMAPVASHADVSKQPSPAAGQQAQLQNEHRATDYEIGHPISATALAKWNIEVSPDGRGLPEGAGDVATGRQIFEAKCSACHGAKGEGGVGDRLVGGVGSLTSAQPVKTVGSYWPYATTLFDYIHRAMPYNAPQSLSANEVYAVCAFLLNANGIVPDGTRLDAKTLPKVKMPNRDGFIVDQR